MSCRLGGNYTQRALILLVVLALLWHANAANHGPVFGLATPTNSQGEWSFDQGVFDHTTSLGSQASIRELVGYGFTPHLTLSFTLPAVVGNTSLRPTRIQPGDDFDSTLAWRFQHAADEGLYSHRKHGVRWPGGSWPTGSIQRHRADQYSGLHDRRGHGARFTQSLRIAGCTFTKFVEHDGSKRPDVFDYSLVYGYRPAKWRRPPDKWDWRIFAELVGEPSASLRQASTVVPNTEAHQVFVGPSALGIYRNYTISFGAQFPVYQNVQSQFPKERVRLAVNFSYLLFQHSHSSTHRKETK